MTTIAIVSHKGGVGKTATSVNLAAALAARHRSVLLVDLDGQATASVWLTGSPAAEGESTYDVLLRKRQLGQILTNTEWGVDVARANLALAALDLELVQELNRENRLAGAITSLPKQGHDFVVVDSPPNLGIATINAIVAADAIIIPIDCKAESFEAVPRLLLVIKKAVLEFRRTIQLFALPTFLERTNLARDIHASIVEKFEQSTLTPINKTVRLAEAFQARQPIHAYDATCTAAVDYARLAKEIDYGLSQEEIPRGQAASRPSPR